MKVIWQGLRRFKKIGYRRLGFVVALGVVIGLLWFFITPSTSVKVAAPTDSSMVLAHLASPKWETLERQLDSVLHQLTAPWPESRYEPIARLLEQHPAFEACTHALAALSLTQQQLVEEVASLKQAVVSLSETSTALASPSSEALPFEVLAMEWWNERAFVRVQDRTDHRVALLGHGDRQGAWQVIEFHLRQQAVTFENDQQARVRVVLP